MSGHRLLPTTEQDKKDIFKSCGVQNMEDLLVGIPKDVRFKNTLSIGDGLSEIEIKRKLSEIIKTDETL